MAPTTRSIPPPKRTIPRCWGIAALLCAVALALGSAVVRAQSPAEIIGRIEGDDLGVKGAVSVEVENGWSSTLLANGSEVTVRSGRARLELREGGEIGICGPAHFSLLKSGAAITLALDYGRVHARLDHSVTLSVYTPMIVATPMAIGEGLRETVLGLESTGTMCLLATRGAVRVEQQLTTQVLLVPQGGEIAFAGGQLESLQNTAGSCQCEVISARSIPLEGPRPPELSVPVPTRLAGAIKPPQKQAAPSATDDPPPALEQPIYKVLMPPLVFDAASPAPPPDPSPETMLLVRQVRVRPAVVFRGRVEPAPALPPKTPAPVVAATTAEDPPGKTEAGVFARIRSFFRRLTSRGPCAGAGCG